MTIARKTTGDIRESRTQALKILRAGISLHVPDGLP